MTCAFVGTKTFEVLEISRAVATRITLIFSQYAASNSSSTKIMADIHVTNCRQSRITFCLVLRATEPTRKYICFT